MNAIRKVPIMPNNHPEFEKANGIASRPDPSEAFNRFANDLMSLKNKQEC